MKDSVILYPIVNKSGFLYEKYKLTPNNITLLNNLFITPLTLYFLYENKFKLSFIFLYLRSIFDGVDGYIARKYKKYSQLGEIYDHVSDSIYIGFIILFCLNKINKKQSINNTFSFIIAIFSMIINFDDKYKKIGEKLLGSGGGYETYSTLINLIPLLMLQNNQNKIYLKDIYEKFYLQIPTHKNTKSYLLH